MRALLLLALATSCGGQQPILANAPKVPVAAAAGAAAAIAGAMTLADPDGAARKQEQTRTPAEQREVETHQTVPSDVLDRADGAKGSASKPVTKP